jgi:hypothetical protein
MSILGRDPTERKGIPVYSGVVRYFPRALAALAKLSKAGNDQHNPGKPLFWDRSKSGDELDAMMRHVLDEDWDAVAWRALANLEKVLEKQDTPVAPDVEEPQFTKPGCITNIGKRPLMGIDGCKTLVRSPEETIRYLNGLKYEIVQGEARMNNQWMVRRIDTQEPVRYYNKQRWLMRAAFEDFCDNYAI